MAYLVDRNKVQEQNEVERIRSIVMRATRLDLVKYSADLIASWISTRGQAKNKATLLYTASLVSGLAGINKLYLDLRTKL